MAHRRILIFMFIAVAMCVMSVEMGAAIDDFNITEVGHFGGATYAAALSGNYAYIGQESDLVALDITDKSAPVEVGRVETSGLIIDITLVGNYAYVADDSNGLVIVDVNNPAAPTLASNYDTGGYSRGVVVARNHAYVADAFNYGSLVIVNVSNPSYPVLKGSYNIGNAEVSGVAVAENYVYVVTGMYTAPIGFLGLSIIDVSNPVSPSLKGSNKTGSQSNEVVVAGDYAYVANGNGLVVVDISNPASPVLRGSYDTAGFADGVAVAGNYAYVADGGNGLVIVDVSNPATPMLKGSYDTAGFSDGVAVAGNYAYVADRNNGLVILRIDIASESPVHNINKSTDHTTIQAAIDDASPGDEIHVDSGTYYENVIVNKQLILRGIDTGAGMPVVDAGGSGNVITISVNKSLLEGFIIRNSGLLDVNAGIIIASNDNVIKNNEVISNKAGINLESSSNNMVEGNIVHYNSYPGIALASANNNIISNNEVNSNGYYGIELYLSSSNIVIDNIANLNTRYGIFVWESDNDNKIISNTANNNVNAGIRFYTSSNNNVSDNLFDSNNYGISIYGSSGNIISENTISFNENGIFFDSSSNNAIYHNNITKNTHQASDNSGPNTWDNGYPSGGNYWSDYIQEDTKSGLNQDQLGSDGIGDTPYPISGGSNVDKYPLMSPYSPTFPPTIQDKSLLQVEGQPEIYWLQNNKLYWVTDWDVINQMSGIPGWDSVNTLPASEFDSAAYEQGPRLITTDAISDGLLIREQGDIKVYLVSGGEKHHFISEEIFLSMGYSFDNVIDVSPQIIQMFPIGSDIGTGPISVGQNAPTPAIEQLFIDAYNRNGGVGVLGEPESDVHEAFGLYQVQNFPGVPGIHGGVLMYNSIQNNASYIHGAIWERYYIFPDKAELGPVKEDEKDAAPSQQGTTGRYTKFETGTIHWISNETGENENNPNRGKSFVTYGDLDKLYTDMGGTYNNWLGFPVKDQEVRDEHGYCEFEGGYIEWDAASEVYIAKPKQSTKIKIAYIPIRFKDGSSPTASYDDLLDYADKVKSYYKKQSYDKIDLNYNFPLGRNNVIIMKSLEDYKSEVNKDKPYLETIIVNAASHEIDAFDPSIRNEYNDLVFISPEKSISGVGKDNMALVNEKGIYKPSLTSYNGGYGEWAHEIGHAEFGFSDVGGHEKIRGDIGEWGLMGVGWLNNPVAPITSFYKLEENWIEEENIYKNNERNIKLLENLQPPNDKIYIYDTINNEIADYYIFEGRENCLKKGVLIFKIKDNKIYPINNAMKIMGPCYNQMTLTSFPWYDDSYDPIDGVKFKATFENNGIKIKIEEYSPKKVKIYNTVYFLPDSIIEGNVPIPTDIDTNLYILTSDSKKVGLDYSSGEYLIEIDGALTSGDVPGGGGEWISIPDNIEAEAYVDLTPELKELIKNDNSLNVEVISTVTTYDENGNRRESLPISINVNSENVDSLLMVSLPITITFLPPITTMDQYNLKDGSTLPIKFTVRNSTTDEFIYDDTVNVTITNSTGHLVTYFTNGTSTDSVRINSTEEQYIANFCTKDYDLKVGETYAVTVTFGELDSLVGYEITYFTLLDGGKAKGKGS